MIVIDILSRNPYPANNTELRHLKQYRSNVCNVNNPFIKKQFSSSLLKSLSFLFLVIFCRYAEVLAKVLRCVLYVKST